MRLFGQFQKVNSATFAMTQFSEVRRAESSHPRLCRCPYRPGGGGSAQDAPRHPRSAYHYKRRPH